MTGAVLVTERPPVDPGAGGHLLAEADHDAVVVDLQHLADLHAVVDLLAFDGGLGGGVLNAVGGGLAARDQAAHGVGAGEIRRVEVEVVAVVAL